MSNLQGQPCHLIVICPCLKTVIVPTSVPDMVATGARWYPNCVSPRNAIRHGEFRKSQGLDSHHQPSLSQSITSPNQCPIHLPPSLILPLFSHSQLHIRCVVILVDWASSHQGADGPLLSAGLPAGPPDHQEGGDEREAKRERTGRERWGSGDSRRGCNGSDLST